jgi:pimeloyl-ACP methyl ester carboxylesterase
MRRFLVIFTSLLVVVILALQFRRSHLISYEDAVERFSTGTSHFLDWKGIKLHYTDKGEGVPVILFHGYAGSFDNWGKLGEMFPEGYRLIIPDLPGLGLSQFPEDLPEGTDYIELYTDFSSHLIDELDLDSVYLVGNSMGGFLAWETTLRNEDKVKRLVLLNAAGYSVNDIGAFFIKLSQTRMFERITRKGAPKFIAWMAARGTLGDKSRLDMERLDAFYGMMNKEGSLDVIGQLGTSGQYPDSSRIREVDVPTLIVWGDRDAIIPVEHAYKFHRDIEGSRLLIYEGSGHVPMLENAERLAADITDFFETETAGGEIRGGISEVDR